MYQTHSPQQKEQFITSDHAVHGLMCEIDNLEGLAEKGLMHDFFQLSTLYESMHRLKRIIALSEAQSLSHTTVQ